MENRSGTSIKWVFRNTGFVLISIFVIGLMTTSGAWALNESPQTFTLDGQLFRKGTNFPLLDPSVKLKVQIINPNGTCLLYEEEQVVNTVSGEGYFHVNVGSPVGSVKRTVNDPGQSMTRIFQNASGIVANNLSGQLCPSGVYDPAPGAARAVRITVTPSATNVSDVLKPDIAMDSVPQAMIAQSVQGLEPSGILQVNTSGLTDLTQANLEALFAAPAYGNLQEILAGNFLKSDGSGVALPSYSANPAGASDGDIWFDSTTGEIKYRNSSGVQVLGNAGSGGGGGSGSAASGISSLMVGSDLSLNGNVAGTISGGSALIGLADSGVSSGTYSKVTVDTKGRVTAGTVSLVEGDIPSLSAAGKVSGNAITSGTISGSTAISTTGNVLSTGTVSGLSVQTTNLRIFNGLSYIQLTAPAIPTNVNFTLPGDDGNAGDLLSTDGNGVLSWVTALTNSLAAGKIFVGNGANVATAVSMSGDATLSSAGVLILSNTGVGAGTYSKVTVDTKGRVTAAANITSSDVTGALGYTPLSSASGTLAGDVSGSFSSASVDKIKGKSVTAAYISGQMMIFDGTQWVNSVVSGDASLNYAGNLTLNTVPVAKGGTGTTSFAAGRIIASNTSGNALAAFTCSLNQVISFDVSGNAICANVGSGNGTVTSVSSANSFLSVATGTSSAVLTLNVGNVANTVAAGDDGRIVGAAQKSANLSDLASASTARANLGLGTAAVFSVGTSSSNVVQLDTTGRLPAVDGSQLTNLPAPTPAQQQSVYLTSGTSWTSPAGITTSTKFRITVIGGGGGGGGGSGKSGTCGGGGGAGGVAIYVVQGLNPSTAYTYAIGSAGTAGASTGGNGGAGGNSSITINGTTVTGGGGSGGNGATTAVVPTAGGAGGTATNGTININGQAGGEAWSTTGQGQHTPYGVGGPVHPCSGSMSTSYAGTNATGYGASGSGAAANGSSNNNNIGGAGAPGLIVLEYAM